MVKVGAASGIMNLHPSDWLTMIASRLAALNLTPNREADILSAADATRMLLASAWELAPADLYQIGALRSLEADLSEAPPETLAEAAVILDIWHRFAIEMPGDTLPEAASEAQTDFKGVFRYNSDPSDGRLIPGKCTGVTDDPDRDRTPAHDPLAFALARLPKRRQMSHDRGGNDRPALPARLLRNTTWLPPKLACGHPDSRELPDREINLSYYPVTRAGRTFPSRPLRLAIAPLAETAECAAFVPTRANAHYTIAPQYGIDRLMAALENALEHDADLLMLPEMTVEESVLEEFGRKVFDAVRGRFRSGQRPRLAYILVGTTRPAVSGASGTNYLRVLDTRNLLSARQDKICRWNLSHGEQARFGLDRAHGKLSDPVKEDIDQAEEVVVFDIDGFGRLICLICASVNHNRPGDWLVHNVRPDWIYAPVMDSSTCWTNAGTSPLEKWTILRAYRAACISRGRVIVTNSMTLQDRENRENLLTEDACGNPKETTYPLIGDPGICFAIDRTGDTALYSVCRAEIPTGRSAASETITKSLDWGVGWTDFDEELRTFQPK